VLRILAETPIVQKSFMIPAPGTVDPMDASMAAMLIRHLAYFDSEWVSSIAEQLIVALRSHSGIHEGPSPQVREDLYRILHYAPLVSLIDAIEIAKAEGNDDRARGPWLWCASLFLYRVGIDVVEVWGKWKSESRVELRRFAAGNARIGGDAAYCVKLFKDAGYLGSYSGADQ
jgi:hypothetical protein